MGAWASGAGRPGTHGFCGLPCSDRCCLFQASRPTRARLLPQPRAGRNVKDDKITWQVNLRACVTDDGRRWDHEI